MTDEGSAGRIGSQLAGVEPDPDGIANDAAIRDIRARVISSAGLVVMRGLAVRAVALLANLVLARLLTPADFGVLAFGLTVVALGTFLTDVGMSAQLIRGSTQPRQLELQTMLTFQLFCAAVLTATTYLIAPKNTLGAVATVFTATLLLQSWRTPAQVLHERDLHYRPISLAEVADSVVYAVTAVALVALGAGVWGVAAAAVIKSIPGTAYLVSRSNVRIVSLRFDYATFRRLAGFGVKYQAINLITLSRDQGVNLYTAGASSVTVLGYWSLSQRILMVPYFLFEALWRVSYPGIARLLERGSDVSKDIERALHLSTLATASCLVGLVAASPELIPELFGSRWHPVAVVVVLAGTGLVLSGPLSATASGYLVAVGEIGKLARAIIATLIIWSVGLPLLLPRLGVTAHGITYIVSALCESAILGASLWRLANVRVIASMARPFLLFAAVAMLFLAIGRWIPTLPGIGAGIAAAATLTFLGLALLLNRTSMMTLARLVRGLARR